MWDPDGCGPSAEMRSRALCEYNEDASHRRYRVFYVLRVEYLVWAGSPDRYVRKIILFSKKRKAMDTDSYVFHSQSTPSAPEHQGF